MQFYLYLSRPKVDMLFPQVPSALREKVSTELGINIGLVSASVGSEVEPPDDSVSRVAMIERHLETTGAIGTAERPRDWFCGEMNARTLGLWTDGGAVFFVGNAGDALVVLGGSMHNLVGGEPPANGGPPFSHLAPMMSALERMVISAKKPREVLQVAESSKRGSHRHPRGHDWADLLRLIAAESRGHEQRVRFLARLLLSSSGVLLGTPLYVAAGSGA